MSPDRIPVTKNEQQQSQPLLDMASILRGGGQADTQAASEALRTDFYKQSVALIQTFDGDKPAGNRPEATTGGTGFFVSRDGLLATDYHVVSDGRRGIVVKTADGAVHNARVVAVDPSTDLALLKVEPRNPNTTFVPVELAPRSTDLRPSDAVYTRGHPRRTSESIVTEGDGNAVSRLNLFNLEGGYLPGENPNRRVISSMLDVEKGNSGGFLARKSDNKVVGVIGFENKTSNGAVSTPVEDLHALIAKYRAEGGGANIANLPRVEVPHLPHVEAPRLVTTPPQFTIRDIMGCSPRIPTLPLDAGRRPTQLPESVRPLPQPQRIEMLPWSVNPPAAQTLTPSINRWSTMRILPPRQ